MNYLFTKFFKSKVKLYSKNKGRERFLSIYIYRVRQILLENALKKTTEYFLNFLFFYLNVQSLCLIMENNFIQMAASADHAVAYTICPIFKHIIDYV